MEAALAEVTLTRPEDGGRRTPPARVYSPLISFDGETTPRPFSVVVRFEDSPSLDKPCAATLGTLIAGFADGELWPGRSFSLWEGRRRVGGGVVREMVLPTSEAQRQALIAARAHMPTSAIDETDLASLLDPLDLDGRLGAAA